MLDRELLEKAGELIRAGGLVAFPTETVYGLGANALDAGAVKRIFEAKGRPLSSPLIVHVDSIAMAQPLVAEWPEKAQMLAERFWPGPLTLVLPKRDLIPDLVTAGLPTVGLRVPAHPVALELIRAAATPIAAPSANPFTRLSPTSAEHVRSSLGDRVDLILDGGPTTVGIESTVLSMATDPPQILRPGMVSQADIEALVGPVELAPPVEHGAQSAPGRRRIHYSPHTPLLLVHDETPLPAGRGIYLWLSRPRREIACHAMPQDAAAYASILYETLHRLDGEGWDWIAVESPPNAPEWAAVADRLRRAAQK